MRSSGTRGLWFGPEWTKVHIIFLIFTLDFILQFSCIPLFGYIPGTPCQRRFFLPTARKKPVQKAMFFCGFMLVSNEETCMIGSPRLALGIEKPQLFHRQCHGRFLSSFWRNHGYFSLANLSWKSPVTRTKPISRGKRDGKSSCVTAPIDLSDFDKSINVFFPRRWIRLQFFLFLFLISSLIWHCFFKSLLR